MGHYLPLLRPYPDLFSLSGVQTGAVQVDQNGDTLGPASTESYQAPDKTVTGLEGLNDRQVAAKTMSGMERSMQMWRKVQPGVMRSAIKLPDSTMKEHFV